jgi:hypothetical protein
MIRTLPNGAWRYNLAFSCILTALSAKIHRMQATFSPRVGMFTLLSGYTNG